MNRKSSQRGGSRTPNKYLEGVKKRAGWVILIAQFFIVMNTLSKLDQPKTFTCRPNFYHGTMECVQKNANS